MLKYLYHKDLTKEDTFTIDEEKFNSLSEEEIKNRILTNRFYYKKESPYRGFNKTERSMCKQCEKFYTIEDSTAYIEEPLYCSEECRYENFKIMKNIK